jgi:glutathione synthase/RimK-type ligase-like ATP-grasp enzyme
MILVAGIPDEGPTARVVEALEAIGANHRVFDQRRAADTDIEIEIADAEGGGAIGGTLIMGGETIRLEEVKAIYLRLMDDNLLPDVAILPLEAPERRHCRRLHELLVRFADIAPGRVLNRPSDMSSNQSKPFQAHAIRAAGFDIPETVITNDPAVARDFIDSAWADGGSVIYKSVSGIRSIVQAVTAHDLTRLDRIRWCPTQFQRRVPGTDIRVHVVGATALAAAITSEATDYRYAARDIGIAPTIARTELNAETRARCMRLAERLRLPLAGIDLRQKPDGRQVCFEVNPSPAFNFYEARADLPIAAAIARYLAGEAD